MSSIQNEDIKGIPELDASGLPHSLLIHDTKIWISAEGISRTLHDAILDRAIGLKGTAGAQVKEYSVFTESAPIQVGSPQAVAFNGISKLTNSDSEFNFLNDFTIVTWVKLNSLSSDFDFISKWGLIGNRQYRISFDSILSKFIVSLNKADNTVEVLANTFSPVINTWYMLSIRYTKNVGVEFKVGSGAWQSLLFVTPLLTNSTVALELGNNFSGSMDSTSFYKSALSDIEVDQIYNNGNGRAFEILPVQHKQKIVAQLDFDEGNGSRNTKGSSKQYIFSESGGLLGSDFGLILPYTDNNVGIYGASLNLNGNTEISVPWGFRSDSLIFINIGLTHYMEFVSDTVTPDSWFKKLPLSNSFEISGDVLSLLGTNPITISSLVGVPPPSAAINVVTGLQPLNEAFGNTSGITQSTNVTSVSVVNGKTRIEFLFDIDSENMIMLYVNNRFWPRKHTSVTLDKFFKVVNKNTIELDSDYNAFNYRFYLSVFPEKNIVDNFGNLCLSVVPYFRTFSLQSPNLATWALGINANGEFVTNDLYDTIPEPIRLRRDDGLVVSFEVDNNGTLFINDAPIGSGLLFNQMFFESPDGSIWELKISSNNAIYTVDGEGRLFQIKDKSGSVSYQIQQFSTGAIAGYKVYPENAVVPDPIFDETNEVAFCFITILGTPIMHYFNKVSNQWELFDLKSTDHPIGEVIESILPPDKVASIYGPYWVPMDGTVNLDANIYKKFADLRPGWVDLNTNLISIPKSKTLIVGFQSGYPTPTVPLPPPTGFKFKDLVTGLSSNRRIYFGTPPGPSGTLINDYYNKAIEGVSSPSAIAGGATNTYQTGQRAAGLAQQMDWYESNRQITRYIKVR